MSRFQNVGLEGAPNTQTFSAHSPLVNQRMSVGFMVVHDKIGVIGQTGINAIYSYRIPMNNDANFSFGLQAGLGMYNAYFLLRMSGKRDRILGQVYSIAPSHGMRGYPCLIW